MNSAEPQFELTDDAGGVRKVRIVKNYIEAIGAKSFQAGVADVVDVVTGEVLRRVPLAKLIPLEST